MQHLEQSALKNFMGDHFETEKYILDSGLTYTFLRDNLYADIIPMFIGADAAETGIHFPAGTGRVPYSLRKEMAEAFANVLSTSGHENKTYEISNGASYSYEDVASALSAHTGKPVSYHAVSAEEFTKALSEAGVPEEMIGFSLGFATAIKDGDFDIPNTHLEQLLGRKPSSLNEMIAAIYQ
jgi:NAD(P)H dehydrogenase (quinone)